MTPRISKLILAAVLAASLPAAARASDGCDHPRGQHASPVPHRPEHGARRWSEAQWRERQLQRVRAELRALEAERAEFHARYAGRPGKLRRYDRVYAERRTELERRRAELQHRYYAWR